MASPLFVYEFVWRVQSCLLQWVQAARKAGLPSPGEGDISLDNARLRAEVAELRGVNERLRATSALLLGTSPGTSEMIRWTVLGFVPMFM